MPDSPCYGVCTYDENKVCIGCLRTDHEIVCWSILTPEEKKWAWDRFNSNRQKDKLTPPSY